MTSQRIWHHSILLITHTFITYTFHLLHSHTPSWLTHSTYFILQASSTFSHTFMTYTFHLLHSPCLIHTPLTRLRFGSADSYRCSIKITTSSSTSTFTSSEDSRTHSPRDSCRIVLPMRFADRRQWTWKCHESVCFHHYNHQPWVHGNSMALRFYALCWQSCICLGRWDGYGFG